MILALVVIVIPFRMLTGWAYNRTGSLFLVGLIHAAGNGVAGGSGFAGGFLPRLYPDDPLVIGFIPRAGLHCGDVEPCENPRPVRHLAGSTAGLRAPHGHAATGPALLPQHSALVDRGRSAGAVPANRAGAPPGRIGGSSP